MTRPFRIVVLATGPASDLGFNNMINQGRIGVSKALNIEASEYYVVTGEEVDPLLRDWVRDRTVDFVICSSVEHSTPCLNLAKEFLNTSHTYFLVRGSGAVTNNTIQITYNYASSNYISGYLAGLESKTKKIGFLSPGAAANNNDSFVYAFWVGAKHAEPNIEFYYYNIGSYLSPDATVRATESLINDYKCDVLADTLDDFSLGNTVIDAGLKAMGTNGFPQRTVHGENVLYSYAYNWTKYYLPITKNIMYNLDPINAGNQIPNAKWYADFNSNPDQNFFDLDFSVSISNDTKKAVLTEVKNLTDHQRKDHYYYCNTYLANYSLPYNKTTGCISTAAFFYINAPLEGMTYLGLYNISIDEVKPSHSVQYSISIVSGILMLIVLLMMLGIGIYKDNPSIRSASPIFLNFILFGGLIIYLGGIIWVSPVSTHQCNARFWLVTLGFTTLIASLVVKNVRIWLIFDNPELKAIKITNYQLFPYVGAFLLVNVLLMGILTGVGDLRMVEETGIDGIGKYEFMKVCKMNSQGAATLYTILGYFAALLLVGVFVSWKIRIVDIEEFNESRAIANTLYAISFCLFVIVPLMVAPQEKQSETIILCVAGLFITTAALAILFVPKFYRVFKYGVQGTNDMFKSKKPSNVATARAESASKNSQSSGTRTNRRGNMIDDFSDDSESSVAPPPASVPATGVTGATILAEFTDDSVSDIDDNETEPIENDNEDSPPSSAPTTENN
ncbi:hypothetical protein DICPUDRAFT_34997 [Dictyostelium purpureum]|uniref:G-protein coupled receptors family 3 profile domain-containing protein n=1 Tax=Dictyostelium purpureum TaxID=5786 RepID=F0ZNP2_DICPU|nr:uncharacterized protein DICPUDRAFT_34997 [Dictyostelium purpureum]EGC34443.1 hypothetical protein DICPUDRAFT_34997 [Dictyostelium purpureum]|eukprot:XP_003289028.1 hypothetical protein DICPUDRAFT_34997 [Dictyostelium purpureum]